LISQIDKLTIEEEVFWQQERIKNKKIKLRKTFFQNQEK
jgi:hypothetical protein